MNGSDNCKEDGGGGFGLPVLFGSRRRTQLLGILANEYQTAVTPTEIVQETDFNYQSLYNHLNPLTELGVIQSSNTRKPAHYQLNPESATTETLIELHDYVTDRELVESPDTFEPLFSSRGHAKLMSGLTRLERNTFTQPTATNQAGISSASFYSIISELEDLGVVVSNGKDGKAVQYELRKGELWRLLAELDQTIREEVPARGLKLERES